MASKQIINMLKEAACAITPEVQSEKEIIAAETRCILDTVRTMGEGDWAAGTVRAFAAGVLDVPLPPAVIMPGGFCRPGTARERCACWMWAICLYPGNTRFPPP